jgi:hypothetical protein
MTRKAATWSSICSTWMASSATNSWSTARSSPSSRSSRAGTVSACSILAVRFYGFFDGPEQLNNTNPYWLIGTDGNLIQSVRSRACASALPSAWSDRLSLSPASII